MVATGLRLIMQVQDGAAGWGGSGLRHCLREVFTVSGQIKRKVCKFPIKQTVRLFRHQITLTKQHFNDLSINESETHGLHFFWNTQGFSNQRRKNLASHTQRTAALPGRGVSQFSLQPSPPSLDSAYRLAKAVILDLGTERRAWEGEP